MLLIYVFLSLSICVLVKCNPFTWIEADPYASLQEIVLSLTEEKEKKENVHKALSFFLFKQINVFIYIHLSEM